MGANKVITRIGVYLAYLTGPRPSKVYMSLHWVTNKENRKKEIEIEKTMYFAMYLVDLMISNLKC